METLLRILERASGYRPTLYLKIENPPYMALIIEATPEPGPSNLPSISVAHYGEQNGDLMRDPEMCFELSKPPLCGLALSAWYFRNDYLGVEQYSRYRDAENYVFLPGLYAQHEQFARQWDRNIRAQGCLELQPAQQEEALAACYQEQYANGSKNKRMLLPVRHLQQWIEHNILLELADAPFSKEDVALVPEAGSCVECPKRTGHNVLLFAGLAAQHDSCSDPKCWTIKVDAHVRQTITAKPKLVQISTAYGTPKDGSAVVPRNKYVEIRCEKPTNPKQRDWPEYKTCKFTTEAIVTEGNEKGELRKVCADPDCPIHHARKQKPVHDAQFKAEQEKRRREEAIANATGLRVLSAIREAVPVRLMKRDLLFVAERMVNLLDENRAAILAKQHGIKKTKENEAVGKPFTAFLRRTDESTLGRAVVEAVVLLTATRGNASHVLRDAAEFYKVDVAAITAQVKQEFAAKEKAKAVKKPTPKPPIKAQPKSTRKSAAA